MVAKMLELDARLTAQLAIATERGPRQRFIALLGHTGDSWYIGVVMLLLYLFAPAFWKTRAVAFVAAILVTAVVVITIKTLFRRQRPEGSWGQIYRKTDPHSFPSGHAARAVMMAVLALGMGPAWLGWVLLFWAPLVGFARIATGLHYVSDVVAGWVVGLIMGVLILQGIQFYNLL
jgi:undecaprenyl-diphosphatase